MISFIRKYWFHVATMLNGLYAALTFQSLFEVSPRLTLFLAGYIVCFAVGIAILVYERDTQ